MRERPIAVFKYGLLRRREFLIRPNQSSLKITCSTAVVLAKLMWQTYVYFISSLHCPQPSPLFYHYVHFIYSSSVPYGLVVWKIKTILGGIRTTKSPKSLLICNFGRDILGKLGRERPCNTTSVTQPILSTAMNAINIPTL